VSFGRPAFLSLHGLGLSLHCEHPVVCRAADAMLGHLAEAALPFPAVAQGEVCDYDGDSVLRHVSRDSIHVAADDADGHPLLELYRTPTGDRWWLVDERWGLCEIDLVRSRWTSFVLPQPNLDGRRLVEQAIYWPMSHLLRRRGLHLLPAASFGETTAEGRRVGALLLSPFDPQPEVHAAASAGFGVIGARWSALRLDNGRPMLLALPGGDASLPRVASAPAEVLMLADPMRRQRPAATTLSGSETRRMLLHAWPMPTLGATDPMPGRLAETCVARRVRLSRDGTGLTQTLGTGRTIPHIAAA
jgi:hypothetical protein